MSIVGESLTDQDEVQARIEQALLFDARGSMEDTERNMYELGAACLKSPKYRHYGHFLDRYSPVTFDVGSGKDNNEFRRPDVIESAVVEFYHTSKDPVAAAILDGERDGIWAEYIHDESLLEEDEAIQFFKAAYIHIRSGRDLPSILAGHGLPKSYFVDYFFRVGKILRQRGREYAREYVNGRPVTQEAVALTGDVVVRAARLLSWVDAYPIKVAMDNGDHEKVRAIQDKIEDRTRRELKLIIPAAKMTIRAAEWSDNKATAASSKIAEVIRQRRLARQAA